ncbi:MAG: tyrosine-type recombinase/integrase, partial [Burkholderiales bacterium]
VKNNEDRVVVLNRVALSVVEQCRGMHPEFVFVYRPNIDRFHSKGTHRPNHVPKPPVPVGYMNNNAWDKACLRAAQKLSADTGKPMVGEFAALRVHDIKHTFGRRLRAAGVPEETRKVLLGHRNGDITVHYSAAELNELLEAANKVCDVSRSAPTLTLLKRTAV